MLFEPQGPLPPGGPRPRIRPVTSRRWAAFLLTVGLLACLATTANAETASLKFATLLPQNSPWGRELKKWAALVASDTGGDLQIDFQWNGQAGDEILMVQKIRTGQIDGAIVSAAGLAQTGVSDALIFGMPGLFADVNRLEAARAAVADDLEKEFEARGYVLFGWGGAGALRTMTVGYEVHHPSDLRGKGVFVLPGDPVGPLLYAAIGGITPRSLAVTDILPGLQNGSVTFLAISPLLAEQLQFASRVTHVCADTFAFAVGGKVRSITLQGAVSGQLPFDRLEIDPANAGRGRNDGQPLLDVAVRGDEGQGSLVGRHLAHWPPWPRRQNAIARVNNPDVTQEGYARVCSPPRRLRGKAMPTAWRSSPPDRTSPA